MDAQRMANRVKDLDALGSALLEEAETNNRLVESLRQYQDDIESLNRISNNKTNADMVNRIQQQNINSSEILKENRELKICIEDYERVMELMMQCRLRPVLCPEYSGRRQCRYPTRGKCQTDTGTP